LNGYLIPKDKLIHHDFAFLIQAEAKSSGREFMNGIHVEKEGNKTIYVCTDGKRMHYLEYEDHDVDIAPGNYDIRACASGLILCPKKEDSQYPNWRKVIPEGNDKHFTHEFKPSDNTGSELFLLYQALDNVVDMKYFDPLRNPVFLKWDISFKSGFKAIVFKSESRTAVIMPLNPGSKIEVKQDTTPLQAPETPESHTIATPEGNIIAEINVIDINEYKTKKAKTA